MSLCLLPPGTPVLCLSSQGYGGPSALPGKLCKVREVMVAVGSGGCNSWLVLQEDRGTLLSSWGGDRASSEGLNLLG